MSAAGPAVAVGARVNIAAFGDGWVKFSGTTDFSQGKWIGVELDLPNGKNDGTVQGKRYFDCKAGYGVFVRPGQIKVLPTPAAPSPSPKPSGPGGLKRPAAGLTPGGKTLQKPASSSGRTSAASSSGTSPRSGAASPAKASRIASAAGRKRESVSSIPPVTPGANAALKKTLSAGEHARKGSVSFATPAAPSAAGGVPRPTHTPKGSISMTPTASKTAGGLERRKSLSRPPLPSNLSQSSTATAPDTPPPLPSIPQSTPRPRGASISKPSHGIGVGRPLSISGLSSIGGGGVGAGIGRSDSLLMEEELVRSPSDDERDREMEERIFAELEAEENGLSPTKPATMPRSVSQSDPFSLSRPAQEAPPTTRLRILETKRGEDREKLRELDKLKEESEEFMKLKPKLMSRVQDLVGEVKDLKKVNREVEAEREKVLGKYEEMTDQVEMATLDKEVAEEQLEECKAELERERERREELEVEVGVLKEQNVNVMPARVTKGGEEEGDGSGGGGGAPDSIEFLQLQKQNDRLKDALIRLRDLTSETEADYRKKIADLEKELELTLELQNMYDVTARDLEDAEAQIEELKGQLDDSSESQELLERLTERNLTLSEKLEEMRIINEDLEALKELNDELEENHIETEKQLQEEIDFRDIQIRELKKRLDTYGQSTVDYESTISQFRELVNSLQTDIEQLREQHQVQQHEAQQLSSQTQTMLDLNRKLQNSKLKSQVKVIDMELRRLEALQAVEHLSIIKPYLTPSFFENDSESVDSLLFFERLVYKAELISSMIESNHNVTDNLVTVPEELIAICDTRTKLAKFAALSKRFVAHFKNCGPEQFLRMGRTHHELDGFIDALKKEELKETECAKEVDGFIAQALHLSEVHLSSHQELALGERELAQVTIFDLDLDTIASAVGFTKQTLALITKSTDVELDIGESNLDEVLFNPLQFIFNLARSSKISSSKLLRRMRDLVNDNAALAMEHAQGLAGLAISSEPLATSTSKMAGDISRYVADVRESKRPFQLSRVTAIFEEALREINKKTHTPLQELNNMITNLTHEVVASLQSSLEPEHVIKLVYEKPWIGRVRELQSTAAVNVDAERKIVKLNEELRDLLRELRTKDEVIQEAGVKIDLMDKRMEASKKMSDTLAEMEADLAKTKKESKAYEEALETLQSDLDAMEQENTKLKKEGVQPENKGNGVASAAEPETSTSYENMETSRLIEQLEALKGAVRFLRSENSFLKSQDMIAELNSLPTYAVPPLTPPSSPKQNGENVAQPTGSISDRPSDRIRSLALQSKSLFKEAVTLSAAPKIVDLTKVKPGKWMPMADKPEYQLKDRRQRIKMLSKRVRGLQEEMPMAIQLTA
ncbi:hypothetical protein BT69DRAFT_1282355 [Atractiella rhizophila]|nr:hypothetical protein BT69DRAFT_1282355 [Atractiella rhizophila]